MELGGYTGNILNVDLTTGAIRKEPVDLEFIKKFIGGEGGNFGLAYPLIQPKIDLFSESSPIIFGVGPIVGTPAISSARVVAMFKHPAYGTIENSRGGGYFGTMLKRAGYDYVIITGKSAKPAYLYIHNDDVKICDGSQIWGKDLYQATDMLRERHNNASVYAIGPAGERLISVTVGLLDKVSTLGKGGLPALMGSKKLKAIVVLGTKGVKLADPERLRKLVAAMMERIRSQPNYKRRVEMGTMGGWHSWFITQGAPAKNWSTIVPHTEAHLLYSPDIYLKNIKKDRLSCAGCPVGCKDRVRIKEGEFAGLESYGSSLYGRLTQFAGHCNVGSFNRVVKCLDYCNRMGLCVHEVAPLISWAVDLYKHGIITKEDTDGLELDWDFDTTTKLLEKIAQREGFGAVLGEGYLGAIEKIGRGCEKLAIQVKGGSPLYDPRVNGLGTSEFGQVVNPRNAHLGRSSVPPLSHAEYILKGESPLDTAREWVNRVGVPKEAVDRILTPPGRFNTARLAKWAQDHFVIIQSLGLGCTRSRVANFYNMPAYIEIYSAVTGLETSASELYLAAERSYNLLKVLNLREGFSRKDDKFPDRWFEPEIINGEKRYMTDYFGKRLTREDCEKMLDDYYEERGWDIKLGIPTKKRLIELGLGDVAEDLEKSGFLESPGKGSTS